MKINCSKKQRGVVVPLVTIVLPVLLLAAGWALDFGHTFVNKTRLQNALDAAALSAAIAINYGVTKNTNPSTAISNANKAGRETFNCFIGAPDSGCLAPGNDELASLNAGSLVFEYSRTLLGSFTSNPGSLGDFAFVKVTSTNMLNVTPVLIRIVNQFNKNIVVPAIATAGVVGNNCELMPFLLCANMSPSLDTTCSDGACYGYNRNQIYSLIQANCTGNGKNQTCSLSSGNYGLLNLPGSQGGGDVKSALEGKTVNTCPLNNDLPLNTKPGLTWGDVKAGINYRIDTLDTNDKDYYTSTAYADYLADGGNKKRVMAVPIGNCTQMFKPGASTLPQVGIGCVFLTKHAPQGSPQDVHAAFIGSCPQNGVWDPKNPLLNGPYKIVLFKSPGSGDS